MKNLLLRYSIAIVTALLLSIHVNAQQPTISSFTPPGNCPDSSTTLHIFGTNFIGVTAVMVGGKAVDSFTVNSSNSITAWIAANDTGAIKVITSNGLVTTASSFSNSTGYTTYAYIVDYVSGPGSTIRVINTATNQIVAKVGVGNESWAVSVSPDGRKVYVANSAKSGTVSVINTATNTVTKTVAVGSGPSGIYVSPNGEKVYVTNYTDNTVSVINTAADTVMKTLAVGDSPTGVCISPDGTNAYVANENDGTVSVINTTYDSVVATVPVGIPAEGVIVSPDGMKVYVAFGGEGVSIINAKNNTVIGTLRLGNNTNPDGICISPDGTRVYVANEFSNTVSVIDTYNDTLLANVVVGSGPYGISVNADGTKVYVTNDNDNTVSVINTAINTVIATVDVGGSPYSFGNFIADVPTSCSVLTPVTIINMEAENKNSSITINWQTATELNTSHFIIQRSTDGSSFTDIGTVKAIGSGANSYSFTDNKPANGINYYRLQSVDKDGASTYSVVVSCKGLGVSEAFKVYPNPARSSVTISGNHIANVQVIDNMGRVVKVVTLRDATNPTLSVSSLPAGVYHIRIQTIDGNVSGVGFVKE